MTNKSLRQDIESVVRKEFSSARFNNGYKITEHNTEPCFKAHTYLMGDKTTTISYNPIYEQEKGDIMEVARDLARHEIDHHDKTDHPGYSYFKGCPRNIDNHARLIVEPIREVLKRKGYGINDIHYIANALEDSILHKDLSQKFGLEGISSYFEDIGKHKPFTEFYTAHVMLNMCLWGNKKQKKAVSEYFVKQREAGKVVAGFLKKAGISGLTQKVFENGKEIEAKDGKSVRDYLNDEANWPKVSKAYAEEFSKLMKPGYAMQLPNHSGKGTSGFGEDSGEGGSNPSDDDDGEGDNHDNEPRDDGKPCEDEGNEFDKEMYGEDYKAERVNGAYSSNEKQPGWISKFEAMDIIYKSLAKKLEVIVKQFTQQGSMPIYHYGKKEFDPEKDQPKKLFFGPNNEGKIVLMKKRWHEDIPLEYKVKPEGFPEIRLGILDTSGTMIDNPTGGSVGRTSIIPWGDSSKYHYALLAWYGLLEYLRANHLLKQQTVSIANFSNKTIIGEGLDKAKRVALSPQWGGTSIDLDKIKKTFKGREMLMFTISDGEIDNWDEIKDEFIKNAKMHHYFHLQIGSHNKMSRNLKSEGIYVETIKNAKDLATKVIDLTNSIYRGKQ